MDFVLFMNFEIVPTSDAHIDGFWNALDSVAREKKHISFLEGPPIENLRKFIQKNIDQNSVQFVVLIDNQVVGWCDIIRSDRTIFQHAGTLGLGIIKEFRGKGIGNALIQAALDKAKNIGLTRIDLTVRSGNEHALRIYKKFGFQVEGVKKNAVRLEGIYEDVTSMALLLDEQHIASS